MVKGPWKGGAMELAILADGLATNLFLVGLALTVVMFLFRSQLRAMRRKQESDSAMPGGSASVAKSRGTPAAASQNWEVAMHDLARDLTGRLDTKLALLESLIQDARHEADRLEALLRESRQSDDPREAPRRRPHEP